MRLPFGLVPCIYMCMYMELNATNSIFLIDPCPSVVVFIPDSVPPQAMLIFRVSGGQGGTLTDTCSRLIEPLPTDSMIMHCPYVGDDIEVICTADGDPTIILEHNNVISPDGTFRIMNAQPAQRPQIVGPYTCTAQLVPGCATQVVEYAQLYGKQEMITTLLHVLLYMYVLYCCKCMYWYYCKLGTCMYLCMLCNFANVKFV